MTKHVLPGIFDESAEDRNVDVTTKTWVLANVRLEASREKRVSRNSSSPIRGPMALLHPDIDSPPRYSRVRRPAGTFGRAFRSLKAARISPQNIGRIVCSRLTRSFPPLRLLFFIRASFSPPLPRFSTPLGKTLTRTRKRERERENPR